jgi:hypothetical protein
MMKLLSENKKNLGTWDLWVREKWRINQDHIMHTGIVESQCDTFKNAFPLII